MQHGGDPRLLPKLMALIRPGWIFHWYVLVQRISPKLQITKSRHILSRTIPLSYFCMRRVIDRIRILIEHRAYCVLFYSLPSTNTACLHFHLQYCYVDQNHDLGGVQDYPDVFPQIKAWNILTFQATASLSTLLTHLKPEDLKADLLSRGLSCGKTCRHLLFEFHNLDLPSDCLSSLALAKLCKNGFLKLKDEKYFLFTIWMAINFSSLAANEQLYIMCSSGIRTR